MKGFGWVVSYYDPLSIQSKTCDESNFFFEIRQVAIDFEVQMMRQFKICFELI